MPSLFSSTKNTRMLPIPGRLLLRSDAPTALSPSETEWLKAQNIRTLVDLRTDEERAQRPCPLERDPAFRYLSLPVTGGNAVPRAPEDVPLSYLAMVDAQMERILSVLLGAKTGALFFCSAGKDRTGVVSALLLRRFGADEETIVADYMLSAENLRAALEDYARRNPQIDPRVITPRRENMTEFLRMLRER